MTALLRPRPRRSMRRWALVLAGGLALAHAAAGAPSAGAVVFDPCGTIKESEIALAFGLKDVIKHNTLVTELGNPAGVVQTRCTALAWRGPRPGSEKRERESLLAGTLARLSIRSWVPDETPQALAWRARFAETLKRLRGTASELFLMDLDGTRLLPPRFGAESAIAFTAAPGPVRRVRGLWWSHSLKSLLVFDAVEARGEPTVAALKQIASIVAGEFFLRPQPAG